LTFNIGERPTFRRFSTPLNQKNLTPFSRHRDDTLNDEIQSIRSLLDRASSGGDRDRASALDRAEKKLRAAQGTRKSYKMETRLVPDPRQKQMFENKLKRLSEQLSQCANDMKALRGNQQRGELFVGARGDQTNVRGEMSGDEAGNMMINEMNDIQDKTKSSIMNTKNMVSASKQVGEATMEELLRQREQIRNIDDEVMRVDDNLNRADKLIQKLWQADGHGQVHTVLRVRQHAAARGRHHLHRDDEE
ncbi:hypothetical protein THAOC_03981, partial [Thalassiosira oceanica]